MRDLFVDVTYEVELAYLVQQADPVQHVIEMMRVQADKLCDENKATLRTDRVPEFNIRRATHRITGVDVVLCASRWAATAPDDVLVSSN